MKKAEILSRVCAAIPTGREYAVHQADLANQLDLKPDVLKRIIRQARRQGEPILSGSDGYWYSESREELESFVNMMHRQAVSRFSSSKAMNDSLKQTAGQQSFTESLERDYER